MSKKIIVFTLCFLVFACTEDNGKITYVEDLTTLKNTTSGQVIGFKHINNSTAWFGIPYAKPPINELRWRAPQPIENSEEIIKATSFSDICFQNRSFVDYSEEKENYIGSEDCLYLNIHSPRNLSGNENLPVMVWIHGGGNTTGAGSGYDFSRLASEQKVIVITINYRLGPFGWFYHPSLIETTNSKEDKSGNYGLLDQILALKWVRQNIKDFGGNPNNVTIFGESAGGKNVFALLSSPLAKGLFHKAISQSGATNTITQKDASKFFDGKESSYGASSREAVSNLLVLSKLSKDENLIVRQSLLGEKNIDDIPDEELKTLTKDLRKSIDFIGDSLAKKGILPEDVIAQNQGTYLPRMYLKYLDTKKTPMGYTKSRKELDDETLEFLGEIEDVSLQGAKAIEEPLSDIVRHGVFEKIAENPNWVFRPGITEWRGKKVTSTWLKDEANRINQEIDIKRRNPKDRELAEELNTLANQADENLKNVDTTLYKQIPDTKEYGTLRGAYIRKEIYNDMISAGELSLIHISEPTRPY